MRIRYEITFLDSDYNEMQKHGTELREMTTVLFPWHRGMHYVFQSELVIPQQNNH